MVSRGPVYLFLYEHKLQRLDNYFNCGEHMQYECSQYYQRNAREKKEGEEKGGEAMEERKERITS